MTANIAFVHTIILKILKILIVFLLSQNIQFHSHSIVNQIKRKKMTVYNNASWIYNKYLEVCFNQYMTISYAKKRKLSDNCDPKRLFLDRYHYSVWSKSKEESTDKGEFVDLSDIPLLEVMLKK